MYEAPPRIPQAMASDPDPPQILSKPPATMPADVLVPLGPDTPDAGRRRRKWVSWKFSGFLNFMGMNGGFEGSRDVIAEEINGPPHLDQEHSGQSHLPAEVNMPK